MNELLRWNNTDIQAESYFLSTIVEIHIGEEAYGVSAGNGVIRATLRAKTDTRLHEHVQQLKALVASACELTPGLQHEIEWVEPFSANENDPHSVTLIKNMALRNNLPYIELQHHSVGEKISGCSHNNITVPYSVLVPGNTVSHSTPRNTISRMKSLKREQ